VIPSRRRLLLVALLGADSANVDFKLLLFFAAGLHDSPGHENGSSQKDQSFNPFARSDHCSDFFSDSQSEPSLSEEQ
jgi:hypothetical protein